VTEPVVTAIVGMTHDGRGVADVDGRRVFVAGGLPEEQVEISLDRRRRHRHEASLERIVRPAATRVDPHCEYFGRCGGCALQHMTYESQIAFKQDVVQQAFERIGGLEPRRWLPPATSAPWGYRRRARLGVRLVEAKGRVLVGFRERASNKVTDMQHCPVLAAPVGAALGDLAQTLGACEAANRVPQVEVALGDTRGALVFRVLGEPAPADRERFEQLARALGLAAYVQTAGPGSVRPLGQDQPPPLTYALPEFDLELEFAPTDFVQVNAEINRAMVHAAVAQAGLDGTERVLDLFCGLGNFSLPFARRAESVLGVESDAGLIARAAQNARRNGIHNAKFMTADLGQSDWSFLREPWDIVLLDPPRSGAAAVASCLATMAPRRIIYVSCHPATLARDAKAIASDLPYDLTEARIFDMFPNTHHVEVMAVFDRHR
jgi:23S rRNA (uracil1939-C5)-methyltransferase